VSSDNPADTSEKQLRPLPPIAIYVDVQNIYYTVKQKFACHFNYSALWSELSSQGQIVQAIAYATDRGDARQRQFQQILRNIGFTIKLKPFIKRADGSTKGDWDVGITLDIIEIADQVSRVVLLSGDGDFDLLMHKLRDNFNTQTIVYGVPSLTAESLINAASEFRPINHRLLLKSLS